jgi:hypothetical protein
MRSIGDFSHNQALNTEIRISSETSVIMYHSILYHKTLFCNQVSLITGDVCTGHFVRRLRKITKIENWLRRVYLLFLPFCVSVRLREPTLVPLDECL